MQYFQKLIQKDLGFGYNLADPIPSHDRAQIWSLHNGTSKENGDPALVFLFNPSKSPSKAALAKSGLMRLKTLRHPDILKYVASVEGSDATIYIATEQATPLATILANNANLDHDAVQWGLYTIARALGFLHTSGMIHGRVNPSTVFVTPSGDWKLGGLECVTSHQSASSLGQYVGLQPDTYQSPEFSRGNWSAVSSGAPSAVDSWALGCLMYEAHAGSLSSPDELQNMSVMPKQLLSAYQKLLASNASTRAPAEQVPNHPYFKGSKFVELNMFVENLALKGQLEREAFLGKLPSIMDRLPDGFCTFKILPMLSQSIETGIGSSAAFACVVKMKSRLSEEDYSKLVVKKYVTGWLGNQNLERNLKVELYGQIDLFVQSFDDSAMNDVIFPAMCASFQDMQAPALRDAAVKAVLSVSPKLSDKNLNSVLMSHFARLQVDSQPAIRTNTTVCLGKLAPHLSQNARNKVLVAAFLRSLKDPFPVARSAGINAILITTAMYSVKDIASRLLPAVAPLLVDTNGDVRKLAFSVLSDFEKKLSANHEKMLRVEESTASEAVQNGGGARSANSATTSSTGWGLGSLTAALLNNKAEPTSTTKGTSTGISSEDFKKSVQSKPVTTSAGMESESRGSTSVRAPTSVTTGVSSDTWGSANGSAAAAPAAFSTTPLTAGTFDTGFDGEEANEEDDDEDGWGDMDIKTEAKPVDDEELFVSMMGAPPKPNRPAGISRSASNASSGSSATKATTGGDLWDLAPPLVSKPKTRPPARASGMGLGAASTTGASARRGKKSGGDDWEALLGGTGGSSKRKTVNRSGLR